MKRKIISLLCKIGFIKNFLYRLTCHRNFVQKYKNLAKEHRNNKNKVFVVYTPTHENLGDHAIALAQMTFLEDMGVSYTEITIPELRNLRDSHMLKIFNKTKVFIIGGGNLGTLWFDVETMFRDIILAAPKSDIFVFPSTVYYENSDFGNEEFEKSKKIYNNHKNLTLYAREKYSYEIMKKAYKNVKLVPDMVFYLNKSEKNIARNGAVLCLRTDLEKTLTEAEETAIHRFAYQNFDDNVKTTDMCIDHYITPAERNFELDKKFNQFKKAKLVITDRLHCMIFCAITGTPCIVINSKSPKVKGCYEWIKDSEYIRFADDLSDISDLYKSIPQKEFVYDNSHLKPYFDSLKDDIKHLLD